MKPNEIRVVYDGDCPLCRAFVCHLQPRNPAMSLGLSNARADLVQRRALADQGIDLEEGFAVVSCDACRTGADAAHALAKLHTGTGFTGRFAIWCFGTHRRAELSYPLFRACRRLLLFALRRKPL